MRGLVFARQVRIPCFSFRCSPSNQWQRNRRWLCASPTSGSASSTTIRHLPPLGVRLALVGSTVGLTTPAFIAAGAIRLWSHHIVKTTEGKIIKTVVGVMIGGGTLKLMYEYVIPFLGQHSDIVAPFALSNAISSIFWYGVGELTFGMKFITSRLDTSFIRAYIPGGNTIASWIKFGPGMAGPVVGGLTAVTAPFFWSTMYDLCWSPEMKKMLLDKNPNAMFDFYSQVFFPISLPVGVLAGMTTHSLLESLVVGKQGIPWQSRSLPILIAILSSAAFYFGYCYTPYEEFLWIRRYHPMTGRYQSYNPKTKQFSEGISKHETALAKRASLQTFHFIQSPLNYLFGKSQEKQSNDISVSGQKYEDGKLNDTSQIDSYNSMIQLIDILLRYKHLNDGSALLNRYDLASEKTILMEKANHLGIKSLDKLYKSAELMVVIKRRLKTCTKAEEVRILQYNLQVIKDIMKDSYPEEINSTLWDYLIPPVTNSEINAKKQKEINKKYGRWEVRSLQENIDIFENELFSIFGVKIDDSVYDTWRSTLFWENLRSNAGIPVFLCFAYALYNVLGSK